MRLNKKGQYALLFTAYLLRSGLARTQDVAANLGLSQHFAEQVARSLRTAGIISVKRGPGGGYEIKKGTSPTVAQVLSAVGISGLMTQKDTLGNAVKGLEGRVLNHIVGLASFNLSNVFNETVAALSEDLVKQEVNQLNSISETAVVS